MLEGLTEPAKKVMIGAQQEAHLLGHKYISTEHILLALISDAGGLAAKALQSSKLNLNIIREQTEKIFGRGGGSSGSSSMELRFTHEAHLVLKLTHEEAQKQGHSLADERDLLLGLLKGCDGEITGLLENQGVDVNNIGDQVNRHMAGEKEKASSTNDRCAQDCSNETSQKPTLSVPIKMIAGENEKASSQNDQCAESCTCRDKNNQKPTLIVPKKMIACEKENASSSNGQCTRDCGDENSQKPTLSEPLKMMAGEKEKAYSLNDQSAQGCSDENTQKPILSVPIKIITSKKEKASTDEDTQKPTLSMPTKMIAGEEKTTSTSNEQCAQGCSNENSQKPTLSVLFKMTAGEKGKAYSANDQSAQGCSKENTQKTILSVPIKMIAGEKEKASGNEDTKKPTLSVTIKMTEGEKEKTSSSNEQCAQVCSNENSQKTTVSVPIKMISGEKEKASTNEYSQKPTLNVPAKIISGEKEKTSSLNDQCAQGCSKANSQKPTPSVPINIIAGDKGKVYSSSDQCEQGCSNENSQKPTLRVPIKMTAGEKKKASSSNDHCAQGCGNENTEKPTHVPIKMINMMPGSKKIEVGSKKVDKIMNYQTPILDMFGTNLTKLAQEGKLNPFVGRQEQVERIIQIFGRKTKNNPCLVGEPGVGKTAIIEGLAQRILSGSVPEKLKGKKVVSLNMPCFLYETSYQKTPEARISCLVKEIEENGDVILFVKQIHSFFEATIIGTHKFSYILKHALQNDDIQCIGSTTVDEHRMHMKNDATLQRIFQPVDVAEPSVEETAKILKGLRGVYGTHHNVLYTDEALEAAAKLSQKYICGKFLPEKAIDLIDEAGSYVEHFPAKDNRKLHSLFPEVTKSDIQYIVSSWTDIPLSDVSREEGECLLNLEAKLQNHIIGQNEAINTVCRAIRRARLGLGDMTKPIASFLLTGPTGVGKTELAKALATQYFGSEDALIRVDMSDNMDRHSAVRMVGAPPGYVSFREGGQLTEAVRHRPYSLVLFDEIDKAHADVFSLMLQILDDGRLTDDHGHTVDFKNTLIIMTSNIGYNRMIEVEDNCVKKLVMEEIKKHFRPEFLNRLDEIIEFNRLTETDVKRIADLMLRQVSERMKGKGIEFSVTQKFRDHVVEHGYDPCNGARTLRRTISRLLEDALAEKMLTKEIKTGDSIVVDVSADGNVELKQKKALVSCINLKRNIVAIEKRRNEGEVMCNLMAKMFDLIGHHKTT